MMLSSYIHEQLAAAHRGDLLESANQERLAGRVRRSHARHAFRSGSRRLGSRPQAALERCAHAANPRVVTR